jgi:hypothetical protein
VRTHQTQRHLEGDTSKGKQEANADVAIWADVAVVEDKAVMAVKDEVSNGQSPSPLDGYQGHELPHMSDDKRHQMREMHEGRQLALPRR